MVKKQKQTNTHASVFAVPTLLKAHVFLGVLYILQLVLYDASKIIAPDITKYRWIGVSIFLILIATVYYIYSLNTTNQKLQKVLLLFVSAVDIAFAAQNVYLTRGMASKAVLLFLLALVAAAFLRHLPTLLFVATVAAFVYISTAVSYFVNFFNEGYKVELYGEIGFYAGLFYVFAYALWALVKPKA
jgi:hypothetical protein